MRFNISNWNMSSSIFSTYLYLFAPDILVSLSDRYPYPILWDMDTNFSFSTLFGYGFYEIWILIFHFQHYLYPNSHSIHDSGIDISIDLRIWHVLKIQDMDTYKHTTYPKNVGCRYIGTWKLKKNINAISLLSCSCTVIRVKKTK